MTHNTRNPFFAALCTVALLFAVTVTVEAQTNDPIMDDEIICSIDTGPAVYVARVEDQSQLEQAVGQQATVETLSSFTSSLATAMPGVSVRFEGCVPGPSAQQALQQLGYLSQHVEPAQMRGASEAQVFTL